MSPTAFPLGYTNSNYLYSMVINHNKIFDTTRQITTETTRNIENILTTNITDSITKDALKVEDPSDKLVLFGLVNLVILIAFLLNGCLHKIMENTGSPTERTPLLQDLPPSYTELSPSEQSPPMGEDLGLGPRQKGKK